MGDTRRAESNPQPINRAGLAGLLASAAQRVRAISEAAERAAEGIRTEAEAHFRPQAEGEMTGDESPVGGRARLASDLVEQVIGQMEDIGRHSNEIRLVLERASEAATQTFGAEEEAVEAKQPGAPQIAVPDSSEQPPPDSSKAAGEGAAPPPPRTVREPSEGVRLLATQMAIAGSSPEEITERLREQFGVTDAQSVVDEIFGERGRG